MDADIKKGPVLLSSLTSLRFFAALAVVVHHAGAIAGSLTVVNIFGQVGWLGVSFFFILSGFVLMWSFDQSLTPSAYIARRLARIYPLHFMCLIISIYFFLFTGLTIGGYAGTVPGTAANFLLIQDWVPGHPEIRQAWNGVSWSLSCEFFFYIISPFVFPMLIRSTSIRCLRMAVILWLLLIGVVVFLQAMDWTAGLDFLQMYPLPRAYEFFLGAMGAQWIKAGGQFKSVISSAVLMIVPVFIYCVFVPAAARCSALMLLLFIPGAFLLIVAVAGFEREHFGSWIQSPILVRLGDASFALYMIHALLLGVFCILIRLFLEKEFSSSFYLESFLVCVYIGFSVVASLLVHQYFEHPMRRALLRILSGRRQNPEGRSIVL